MAIGHTKRTNLSLLSDCPPAVIASMQTGGRSNFIRYFFLAAFTFFTITTLPLKVPQKAQA
jgi:hypothetical protein